MTRDEVIDCAKRIVRGADKKIPDGARVIVVVTGEDGEYVGVAANTVAGDVEGILACALRGTERREQRVIDVVDADGSIRRLVEVNHG